MPEEASKMLVLLSVLPRRSIVSPIQHYHRMKRRWVLLLLGGSYFVVIMFGSLPDKLILFPTTYRIDPHGAARQTIPFQNGELEIWTARSRLARQRNHVDAYVLRFYGNADRAERWVALDADAFGERAVEIWGMNDPGFGGSSGPARLKRMSPAALAAFDALKSKAGNPRIYVFGASIGSAVAMNVAANREVRGLILHNPPPLRQIILRNYGWWNLWFWPDPSRCKFHANSIASRMRNEFMRLQFSFSPKTTRSFRQNFNVWWSILSPERNRWSLCPVLTTTRRFKARSWQKFITPTIGYLGNDAIYRERRLARSCGASVCQTPHSFEWRFSETPYH